MTITNVLQKDLNDSETKQNMREKGSEFYNRSMKSWLQDNDIEMYSTHNEGKYIVVEKFIRTLKIKFTNI